MPVRHPFFDLPTPIAIGHRGCAGEVPENTLASFEAGLAAGAAILESDVHLTRDGVPVLIHDDEVDRISDGSGRVGEHTLAELARLDAGYRFASPDGGHPFRDRGLRIPTLRAVLAAFPDARFNLELKEDVPGIAQRTVEVVVEAGRQSLTLLTAGEDAIMARLRRRLQRVDPPIAQGACAGDVLRFVRAALDGAPPAAGPMALQIPTQHAGRPLVTRELVEHAHAHGVQVHVWTVNERAEMTRLLDLGVDGLITDFPGRLVALLAERASAA
jgi:glycerophosphoryl diester phosphodiesterase